MRQQQIPHIVLIAVLLAGFLAPVCKAADTAEAPYFYDRIGDLMLVGRENDIYVENLDTQKRRKVTATADLRELDAFFANGGAMIVYKVEQKKSAFDKRTSYEYDLYMQPTDMNDMSKTAIDYFLYRDLKRERIQERDGHE